MDLQLATLNSLLDAVIKPMPTEGPYKRDVNRENGGLDVPLSDDRLGSELQGPNRPAEYIIMSVGNMEAKIIHPSAFESSPFSLAKSSIPDNFMNPAGSEVLRSVPSIGLGAGQIQLQQDVQPSASSAQLTESASSHTLYPRPLNHVQEWNLKTPESRITTDQKESDPCEFSGAKKRADKSIRGPASGLSNSHTPTEVPQQASNKFRHINAISSSTEESSYPRPARHNSDYTIFSHKLENSQGGPAALSSATPEWPNVQGAWIELEGPVAPSFGAEGALPEGQAHPSAAGAPPALASSADGRVTGCHLVHLRNLQAS